MYQGSGNRSRIYSSGRKQNAGNRRGLPDESMALETPIGWNINSIPSDCSKLNNLDEVIQSRLSNYRKDKLRRSNGRSKPSRQCKSDVGVF